MLDSCPTCGVFVDPALDPVRVIEGVVVAVCRACADEAHQPDRYAEIAAGEDRVFDCACGRSVALWRATTVVTASGVSMHCPACVGEPSPGMTSEPPAAPSLVVEPTAVAELARVREPGSRLVRARNHQRLKIGAMTMAIGAILAITLSSEGSGISAAATNADTALSTTLPILEPEPEPELELMDEIEPEPRAPQSDWIYPLAGLHKYQPSRPGSFGAQRDGRRPKECRRGHCGVDLHGVRGLPIVSVKDGTIDFIGKRRWRSSGLYVKVRHADGSMTYYMHLDEIRPGLRIGQTVRGGEMVGTLGRTGIRHSPAHLHFAWQLPISDSGLYVDPKPLLDGSKTIPENEVIKLDSAAVKRGKERSKKRIERIIRRRRRGRAS